MENIKLFVLMLILVGSAHAKISSEQENVNIQKIKDLYSSQFEAMNKSLLIKFVEDDVTKIASVKDYFPTAILNINKRLKERELLNQDGHLAILCHEMGHFFGGEPAIYLNPDDGGEISSEGQSDYYSTAYCLKVMFQDEEENSQVIESLNSLLKSQIINRGAQDNREIRVISAAYNGLLSVLDSERKETMAMNSKDESVWTKSPYHMWHNSPQCRLDTFVAGALCIGSEYYNFQDYRGKGPCPRSEGYVFGRPRCWYNR